MRLTLAILAVVLSGGLVDTREADAGLEEKARCTSTIKGIRYYRNATWSWQDKIGVGRTDYEYHAAKFPSCAFARWAADLWRGRARSHRLKFRKLQVVLRQKRNTISSAWACIHSREGSWNANTGNGYYGGLQMDMDFQRAYGPEFLARWGTADHWPIWAQIQAAERARDSGRGYGPWPKTARECGLL